LPGASVRRWRKRIRRVARALGEIRDADVKIEYLQGFLAGLRAPAERPGVQRVFLRYRQARAAMQPRLVKVVRKLRSSGILAEMEDTLRELASGAEERTGWEEDAVFYQRIHHEIGLRLEEMLAYEEFVDRPECVAELHALRISAKHVRYGLEVFEGQYDGALTEATTAARTLQQILGDIHDCDVWSVDLPRFIEEERRRTVEYFGQARPMQRLLAGIDALIRDRSAHRQSSYAEFAGLWQDFRRRGVWLRLQNTLRERPGRAA